MRFEPVITEKSTNLAKDGKYTFRVGKNVTKNEIRTYVEKIFGVKVVSVSTLKERGEVKRGASGRKKIIKPSKKTIVTLAEKDKIELFETKKK